MRLDALVEVFEHVGIAVGAAQREVRAGSLVLEAVGGVLVEDPAAPGVEKRLSQFPEFGTQDLEAVPGEIQLLAVKHRRVGILLGQARLELFVRFRGPALCRGASGFRLRQQFRAAGLKLLLGLTGALLELGFDQDVVKNAGDRKPQRLLDVIGVERDLEASSEEFVGKLRLGQFAK